MTPFAKESDIEAAVVLELRQRGWGAAEVIRNPSEADLLANWAQILFENNRGRDQRDRPFDCYRAIEKAMGG
ncbi:MAG: hypothetical protein RLZZ399_2180 [Verrucomicrobiota bacterium]|jgi:type I restriction enzyme R subunit